jgi:hypothetical protein
VRPDEPLGTFVFRPDQVIKKTKTVHYSRLMPRRRGKLPKGRLETSVCRSGRLTEAQVWAICSEFFDRHAPKPAIGRGVGPAAAVYSVGLGLDPDGQPYAEHANIIGWQDSADLPDNELKHFWMDQAQRMAPQFSYLPRR